MRIVNRVLAVAAALALAAGGVLVTAEIVLAGLGQGPWILPYEDWFSSARTNRWDSSGPRALFLGLALAGGLLIALQMVRARPRSLPLEDGRARAGISRRSLEQALARAACSQPGVATATARVRRHRARLEAGTFRPPDEMRPELEETARARLRDLGLDGHLDVAVHVHPHKR